jgi:rod shape-determining protein MreC
VQVFPDSAQVLPINDQFSGVGAALKDSRLQGILKGGANGTTTLQYIMSDEKVVPGEDVITSGGDRIFPKGLPVGKVVSAEPGKDLFLNIRVIPAARLDQLEEVLVVTKITEKMPDAKDLAPLRASDILAERLPTVPTKTDVDAAGNAKPGTAIAAPPGTAAHPAAAAGSVAKPGATGVTANKPAGATTTPHATPSGTNGAAKPKPLTPAATTKPKPPTGAATKTETDANGASAPKRQTKPAAEPAPSAPSEQPSTPPTGAPQP